MSIEFKITSDVEQEDVLPAMLFNLGLFYSIKKLELKGYIFFRMNQLGMNLVDIVLVVRNLNMLDI